MLKEMELGSWTIFSLLDREFTAQIRLACVFGNLGNEALIVTRDDEVYALGSNGAGCLGQYQSGQTPSTESKSSDRDHGAATPALMTYRTSSRHQGISCLSLCLLCMDMTLETRELGSAPIS